MEDRVSRTQYQYTLEDANADELNQWTTTLVAKMQTLPQLRDVATDQQTHGAQATLVIDRVTASRLGITPSAIDNALYDAFGQRQISTLFTQLNQYHVILEALPEFQRNPSKLNDIYVLSTSGGAVPLSAFSHFESGVAPLAINHQGQFPAVTISFNLAPGAALGEATKAIEAAQKEMNMPLSVQASFQGTAQAFIASLANEPWLILAAIITVYIILGVLYESYIHPITILSTLPSAGAGAILALLVTGTELGVVALIGIILLIGIVQKNAIMMIDFALDLERKENKPPQEAIYQACLLRFRPILMTTFAALFGGLPLAFGNGVGSELRKPLGIAIVGGLIVSQVLTLYTTPVIYLWFGRLAKKFSRSDDRRLKTRELFPLKLDEHFRAIHPPSGRHGAADGGDCAGGRGGVFATARRAAAAGGFSDHQRRRVAAGRESGNHGVIRRRAAGTAARPHRRRERNDFVEHARLEFDHAAIRFEPRHQRRGARRAGRHQCRPRQSAGESAEQSDLSQSQSRRRADYDSRADLGHLRPRPALRRGLDDHPAEAVAN